MILVLFRHGHKSSVVQSDDPPLSEKGFKQAEKIIDFVQKQNLPRPDFCWASQKIRAQQTLEKVADFFKTPLHIHAALDVRQYTENRQQFNQRIQKTLTEINTMAITPDMQSKVLYLCTHYDWIEEALPFIDSDKDLTSFEFSSWSPAQHLIFEITDGLWKVLKKGEIHVDE